MADAQTAAKQSIALLSVAAEGVGPLIHMTYPLGHAKGTLPTLPTLTDLKLSYLPLPTGGLLAAAVQGLCVRELNLGMCAGVTPRELRLLLLRCPALSVLSVKDGVHDSPPSTVWAPAQETTLDDSCLQAIVKSGAQLRCLRISHQHTVSVEGVADLRRHLGGVLEEVKATDCAGLVSLEM